jgi:hypothetical protein
LETRFAHLELNRNSTLRQLAANQARAADLRQQLEVIPERILTAKTEVPDTDALRAQIFEMQELVLDQQAKYNEDHPVLQATRKQLAPQMDLVFVRKP